MTRTTRRADSSESTWSPCTRFALSVRICSDRASLLYEQAASTHSLRSVGTSARRRMHQNAPAAVGAAMVHRTQHSCGCVPPWRASAITPSHPTAARLSGSLSSVDPLCLSPDTHHAPPRRALSVRCRRPRSSADLLSIHELCQRRLWEPIHLHHEHRMSGILDLRSD